MTIKHSLIEMIIAINDNFYRSGIHNFDERVAAIYDILTVLDQYKHDTEDEDND